jgi:hypothetical protein
MSTTETDYGFVIAILHSDVMATAKYLAKAFNENDFGLGMSGTVDTEHVANALHAWLPAFLGGKVDDMLGDLDRAIDDAPKNRTQDFFAAVIANAGLAHAHYFPETTGKYGDAWVVASTDYTDSNHRSVEHPEHGYFDDEDDCKAKCHELNVTLDRERNAAKMK